MKKSKEEKERQHRDYMAVYREKHRERVKAQKNLNRGVLPDVFILSCF